MSVLFSRGFFSMSTLACLLSATPELRANRVVLYTEPDFRGKALEIEPELHFALLTRVPYRSREFDFQDRISSVRIEGNVELILFEHEEFHGRSIRIRHDVRNLLAVPLEESGTDWFSQIFAPSRNSRDRDEWISPSNSNGSGRYRVGGGEVPSSRAGNWDNQASSLKVILQSSRPRVPEYARLPHRKSGVWLFQHANYEGAAKAFQAEYKIHNMAEADIPDMNDQISSVRIRGDFVVLLYENEQFRGEVLELRSSEENLYYVRSQKGGNWNDRISSMIIKRVSP